MDASTNNQQVIQFVQEYSNIIQAINELIVNIFEISNESDIHLHLLFNHLDDINIRNNKHDLKSFFHQITIISDNYFRNDDFFTRIESIISRYQQDLINYFTNYEIFNIFKSNKRILYYLFQAKIITIDESILHVIQSKKYRSKDYPKYFSTEIGAYKKETTGVDEQFDFKRKQGENDDIICEFIRKDKVEDFIAHVTRTNTSLNYDIKRSIFETNPFLINKTPSLIQYATFFGSIQIIRYLLHNQVQLDSSLWTYAIHGRNPEIIHLLESEKVSPEDPSYLECYLESLKCHHNEISNYIRNSLMEMNSDSERIILTKSLKYYNFFEFSIGNLNDEIIFNLCRFDHITPFEYVPENMESFDPNSQIKYKTSKNERTETSFCAAVRKGNIEIVRFLLQKFDIDTNAKIIRKNKKSAKNDFLHETVLKASEMKTPLILAVENADYEIAQLLLQQPQIDINFMANYKIEGKHIYNNVSYKNSTKWVKESKTALIVSIENSLYKICELLLSHEINTNCKLIKMYNGDNNLNEEMMYFKEMPNSNEINEEKEPLIIAVENNDMKMIQLLLSTEKINPNGLYTQLIKNIEYDLDYQQKTPLIIAVEKENIEIIDQLLKNKNTDVNYKHINKDLNSKLEIKESALIKVTRTNNEEIIKLLMTRDDLDINSKCIISRQKIIRNALRIIYTNDLEISEEKTALFIAIEEKNENLIYLLLQNPRININSELIHKEFKTYIDKNKYYSSIADNKTEFIKAIETGNSKLVIYLLKNRSDIDLNYIIKIKSVSNVYSYRGSENWSSESYKKFEEKEEQMPILHFAVLNGNTQIVQTLLEIPEIDVNQLYICEKQQVYKLIDKTKNRREEKTALNIAVEKQNVEMVRILVSCPKIDVNSKRIKTSNLFKKPKVETPLLTAKKSKCNEIIQILRNHPDCVNIEDDSIFTRAWKIVSHYLHFMNQDQ